MMKQCNAVIIIITDIKIKTKILVEHNRIEAIFIPMLKYNVFFFNHLPRPCPPVKNKMRTSPAITLCTLWFVTICCPSPILLHPSSPTFSPPLSFSAPSSLIRSWSCVHPLEDGLSNKTPLSIAIWKNMASKPGEFLFIQLPVAILVKLTKDPLSSLRCKLLVDTLEGGGVVSGETNRNGGGEGGAPLVRPRVL